MILSAFWSGTILIEIFAWASDGRTVLLPAPVYPPQIPHTSRQGLMAVLSNVV